MTCGRVALFIALLLSLVTLVLGLKCYECESHTQKGCYPLDTSLIPLIECPEGTKSCIILKQVSPYYSPTGLITPIFRIPFLELLWMVRPSPIHE